MSVCSGARDVIAAIATAHGRGGIGVVRLSGPRLESYALALLGRVPQARHAMYAQFRDAGGAAIDEGIALYFPAPASYTGEDVLELQGHGGPVVLHLLLQRCVELGARIAAAGEFTQRAFLNEKIDLAQAEAVADLIDAATASAARSALRSLEGEFSRRVHDLADRLFELRCLVEATLDFPEEEIDFLERADAAGRLAVIMQDLTELRAQAEQGRLLRDGLHVVLAGQPNVGKSSLLNRLAGEDRAIVSEWAGTTRDTLKEHVQIGGIPLYVVDTAGLREAEHEIERLGMERTWKEIGRADVVLLLVDARAGYTVADQQIAARLPGSVPRLVVGNKCDLVEAATAAGACDLFVSARNGAGIDALKDRLLQMAGAQPAGEATFLARARHLDALARCAAHVDMASARMADALELFAEELREGHAALGEIVGLVAADDLLGAIFSRFCIGK
ncbi:MAG: tRNA uridine-5-carboxymethylaminomethyl(34) synthesis GTPase MnmE [Rhodocyclaceae bacterium]|nr:tRNA uridine-5-carboxymethylaminomethyl(34) synthesis GTPase MnmE [Rhodocyclaceae bacterium]MBX3669549.1 tRNA uridine-5-carboxymethylaminomethyl(34) synthesis GTPase MnmE [Rhodocyclaceae bacterium]